MAFKRFGTSLGLWALERDLKDLRLKPRSARHAN